MPIMKIIVQDNVGISEDVAVDNMNTQGENIVAIYDSVTSEDVHPEGNNFIPDDYIQLNVPDLKSTPICKDKICQIC